MELTDLLQIQLKRDDGICLGNVLDVSISVSNEELLTLCKLYDKEKIEKYTFFVQGHEIVDGLRYKIYQLRINRESVIDVTCRPESITSVKAVTRCTSSLSGHSSAITTIGFSPDGKNLATGSGDKTVRLWDLNTETPLFVLESHVDWVLALSWSPLGDLLASGDKSGLVVIWDVISGKRKFTPNKVHTNWITYISWEPLNLFKGKFRFASSSKDASVMIWDASIGSVQRKLCSHLQTVTCVKWSGEGVLYSSSHDMTVIIWDPDISSPIKILKDHSHWVNFLSLSTESLFRMPFGYCSNDSVDKINSKNESLISCSDDFTMTLWRREGNDLHKIARMTGHKAPINSVMFSGDGRFVASASFDKSIKIWNGWSGTFITSLRGHVGKVYQIVWSPDNSMLCSASSDSTLKVWQSSSWKLIFDLPGHDDEVYVLDWSNDGEKVASGGKDTKLRL